MVKSDVLQSMGSQQVVHNWAGEQQQQQQASVENTTEALCLFQYFRENMLSRCLITDVNFVKCG